MGSCWNYTDTYNIIEVVIELGESFFSVSVDSEEDTYFFISIIPLNVFTGTNVIEGLASFTSD